ncbi:MAG TPA: phospholipase D-like domain-containing protein [Acidobacteriaceae bacterium]|nr:phospholipase D-like domain-containing protein [Acidobacteriaceae bacterium]
MNLVSLRTAFSCSLLALLAGCSAPTQQTTTVSGDTPLAVRGHIHGGQQPVSGASVQLYAVGATGDYSAAAPLLATAATTDGSGNFSITNQYNCGTATEVFIVATGGKPDGIHTNPNLALMAALGPCSALTSDTVINIDELGTVAAVSALHLFMSSPTNIGSSAYDAPSLLQDFTLATQLVDTASGTSPGGNVPSGFSVPSSLINTIGDIAAACVNSPGGSAGDGSACGKLFTLATPPAGTAPADTITALLNVVNHPTLNTTDLHDLIAPDTPFQPTVPAPDSYQVQLTPPPFTITRQLLVEPDDGVGALYDLVNNAKSSIDLTVYGLRDTIFSGDLVAACQRGVIVRVVLDQKYEKTVDTAAYNQLNAQPGCSAVWANPKYTATHEKSFVVDGTTFAMLTLNIETVDYPGTRDFAVLTNDPADIAAFEATFNADYNMVLPYATTPGTDLIWSPTTAQTSLVGIINNATQSLWVENEEMSAPHIVAALEAACQRGVAVSITMTNQTEYHTNFSALEAAGCGVHVLPDSTKSLYIHAKVIIADFGAPAQYAYLGSINFSTASTVQNRELGMYTYDATILQRLQATLAADYASAPAY